MFLILGSSLLLIKGFVDPHSSKREDCSSLLICFLLSSMNEPASFTFFYTPASLENTPSTSQMLKHREPGRDFLTERLWDKDKLPARTQSSSSPSLLDSFWPGAAPTAVAVVALRGLRLHFSFLGSDRALNKKCIL